MGQKRLSTLTVWVVTQRQKDTACDKWAHSSRFRQNKAHIHLNDRWSSFYAQALSSNHCHQDLRRRFIHSLCDLSAYRPCSSLAAEKGNIAEPYRGSWMGSSAKRNCLEGFVQEASVCTVHSQSLQKNFGGLYGLASMGIQNNNVLSLDKLFNHADNLI